MKALELFCGIGGCAAALGERARIVEAIDISEVALATYRANFDHPTRVASVESIPTEALARLEADLWWFSPPCQPFTRRGHRRDLDDPRSRPFLGLLEHLAATPPHFVAMENVPEFRGSRAHGRLLDTLEAAGFVDVFEDIRCPSTMGVPNRRRRYYLIAGRRHLREPATLPLPRLHLEDLLDPDPAPDLLLDADIAERYREAIHVVDAADPESVTRCFTSAYGRSPVRSGSYLATSAGPRRFSPREILRLLDFPPEFRLPSALTRRKAWQLVGNSLSLRPVRDLLSRIPI